MPTLNSTDFAPCFGIRSASILWILSSFRTVYAVFPKPVERGRFWSLLLSIDFVQLHVEEVSPYRQLQVKIACMVLIPV
ncbi:unnamed protein product [Strongylus vulgaris]|uniref:Uncharacterized protein n=1 Tax=Strongylus vulgaris TaxID=40348 RepID=A0A3P7I7A0_STRVU|nr:unnamed protein product [Strongylus vulgaris]